MKKEDQKQIIILTQGGAGDIIAHTPTLRYFRKEYPDDKIVVLSTYSQIWENNPNVDEAISLNNPKDFYSDYILGKNVRFFKKHFVYDHIMDVPAQGAENLLDFICKCYDAEYDGGTPDYFISDYEKRAAETFVRQSPKEKILLHIFGAVPSEGGYGVLPCAACEGRGITPDGTCKNCGGSGKLVHRNKTNCLKDLNPEIVAPIIQKYSERFDFLQIGLEGEPLVPGAFDCLGMEMRESAALIPHCKSFIFIESLFAHIAGALQKEGIVVFQNTSPTFFGYPSAHNICDSGGCELWPCNRPVGALLDFLPGYKNPKTRERLLWECPDQVCARLSPERLEEVFLESIGEAPVEKEKKTKFDNYQEAFESEPEKE